MRTKTRSRSRPACCRHTASWWVGSSGPATSRATIGCDSLMLCGASCRSGCWSSVRLLLGSADDLLFHALLTALRFQLGRLLDDLREHLAGLAALRRSFRDPDRRRVFREDVLEVAVALDALRREGRRGQQD